jgi:hypothetical protein
MLRITDRHRGVPATVPECHERATSTSEVLATILSSAAPKAMRMVHIHVAAETLLKRPIPVSTIKNQLMRDASAGRLQRIGRGLYRLAR